MAAIRSGPSSSTQQAGARRIQRPEPLSSIWLRSSIRA